MANVSGLVRSRNLARPKAGELGRQRWRLSSRYRTLTTSSPGRNSGARNPDVLGQASGTGPDHLGAKTVVICAAYTFVRKVCAHSAAIDFRTGRDLDDLARTGWITPALCPRGVGPGTSHS